MTALDLTQFIAHHPNFPQQGILFYDIGPLLKDSHALHQMISQLADAFSSTEYDAVCGIDSRGFIFGSLLAFYVKKPFFMVRKPGKLPGQTVQTSYDMEYGKNSLQIQASSVKPGEKILIIDDVLATGNTAKSTAMLIEQLGGIVVGLGFVLELNSLKGRDALKSYDIQTMIQL